jgi:hypothetical protein
MAPGMPCKADSLPKLKKIPACAALGLKNTGGIYMAIPGFSKITKEDLP